MFVYIPIFFHAGVVVRDLDFSPSRPTIVASAGEDGTFMMLYLYIYVRVYTYIFSRGICGTKLRLFLVRYIHIFFTREIPIYIYFTNPYIHIFFHAGFVEQNRGIHSYISRLTHKNTDDSRRVYCNTLQHTATHSRV